MRAIDWTGLEAAQTDNEFGSESCLTFYLSGRPEDHLKMRTDLVLLNATNLVGEDGGFVYAKVPITLTKQDIEDKIERVTQSAKNAGVGIDIIDIDSSAKIERTKFHTLWTAS